MKLKYIADLYNFNYMYKDKTLFLYILQKIVEKNFLYVIIGIPPISIKGENMSNRPEEINNQVSKRLKRIEGQIRGITNMINEDRDCLDIIHQIQSANSALKSVWEILAATHLQNCISDIDNIEDKNRAIGEIISKIKELK